MESLINIGLYVAYFALIIAVAALIIFPIVTLFKGNFKNAKGTLIGIGILIVVILVAYIISPAEQDEFYTKMKITASTSKLIGAGLIASYIIFIGLVCITVYTSILKWFK